MTSVNPAEAYEQRINAAAQRMAAAVGDEREVRVIACALVTWLINNAELGAAFEDLCGNVMLPLVFRNTRALMEGDRELSQALRRIR